MSENILKTGISHGDINGISYELILKTFGDARMMENSIPVLYGSSKALAYHRKAMNLPQINFNTINNVRDAGINRLNVINCSNEEIVVEFSRHTAEAEAAAKKALERAFDDIKNHSIDALVMAPSTIDETAFLESSAGDRLMRIFVYDSLRVAVVTPEIPLQEVSGILTVDRMVDRLQTLHNSLVHDFMLTMPRIAVLSLNPGKGLKEHKYGKEENETLIPAIKTATEQGVACFGPYSAEEYFSSGDYRKFSAVLATYSDQGIVPFRLLSMGEGAIFYAGTPFVVTAPEIGVSFSIAGKDESQEITMRNALYLATDIVNNRAVDSKINANPLRKQYSEKKSNNERFNPAKDKIKNG
jgi:4-hydroxythreonine-4-phosphate dehydrogenase